MRTVNATLSPAETSRLRARPTERPEAHDLVLRALDALPDSLGAIELLQEAVEIDPEFAVAYVALSAFHRGLYFFNVDASEQRLRWAKGVR